MAQSIATEHRIIFITVDTRVSPASLRELIADTIDDAATVATVICCNGPPHFAWASAVPKAYTSHGGLATFLSGGLAECNVKNND